MIKKMVPIKTCNPWKPVATKKVDPKTESAMENEVSKYSIPCNKVKKAPNRTVNVRPFKAWSLSPFTILWWAQVTVAPELSKTAVFKRGTPNGFNAWTPLGGHITPISIEGDKLLWKKAQKKEKKNKISDTMKRINPIFKPFTVATVWKPKNVLSLTTSFNHRNITNDILIRPKYRIFILEKWK